MSDADVIEHKREEDERLDTAEDPNDEVRLYRRILLHHEPLLKHVPRPFFNESQHA
jgi:hypothetical protein